MTNKYELCCHILSCIAANTKRRPIESVLPNEFWALYRELTDAQAEEIDDFMVYVDELHQIKQGA